MRIVSTGLLAIAGVLTIASHLAAAEIQAKLASSRVIWSKAPRNIGADLVRFQDRWYVACEESSGKFAQDSAVRIITSKDGDTWEAVGRLESPTPNRGIGKSRFTVGSEGKLAVSAIGVVPNPRAAEPIPRFGGTVNTMAWYSSDGKDWGQPKPIGKEDFPFSRVAWSGGRALNYANGCICGSMQTVRFFASTDGKKFEDVSTETFSGFFPTDAAICFDGETAYCVMARYSAEIGNAPQRGYLGQAKAPYTEWTWSELDTPIAAPNALRLANGKFVVAAGLLDGKARTSICELEPATGKLKEILKLVDGKAIHAGIAEHDGQLWAAYHAEHEGKPSIFLAKATLE